MMSWVCNNYLHDVMGIVLCTLPAAQLDTVVYWAPPSAGLCPKQEVLWKDVMCCAQGKFGWCQVVKVPVHPDAMDVTRSLNITQDLEERRGSVDRQTDR